MPRFLWIAPVVCVLAALSPLLFATETQSRERARIVNAIALAAAGKQITGERAFRVDGDVPYCTGVAGLLSLNHSMPTHREYALWLDCQNTSIREIRLVRRGDSLIILSVFSPSADHINAFSDRKKNAISVPPRS